MAKSKKDTSDLVRGGEKFVKIVANLVAAVRDAGGDESDLDRLDAKGSPLLAAIARLIREPEAIVIGDPEERLVVAMLHADVHFGHQSLEPRYFAESFGDVGGDYLADSPHPPTDDDRWYQDEIESWLAERSKVGYEPATLADGLRYVFENGFNEDELLACFGSRNDDGEYPVLERRADTYLLHLCDSESACKQETRFLLRKARKPTTIEASSSRTGEVAR